MKKVYPSISEKGWGRLYGIIDFYTTTGVAKYIDVPWVIPDEIKQITYKGTDVYTLSNNRSLCGSGEQGFIYLQTNNALKRDMLYITCTPCFRNEKIVDAAHREYFMKCELFKQLSDKSNERNEVHNLLRKVLLGFRTLLPSDITNLLDIIQTPEGHDILLGGVEIGSYYYREYTHNNIKYRYVCGTAIAEPRFSYAMERCYQEQLEL